MKKLIAAVVRQPVTIIMIVALLIFGGVAGTLNMPLQLIPDIKIPIISVIVTYPGASAETVEEDVTSVLETDLSGVSGSTSVTTYSYDNVSAVLLSFDYGADIDELTATVRDRALRASLPDGCGEVTVSAVDVGGTATATLYVTDSRDAQTGGVEYAGEVASEFAGRLLSVSGVGSVETDGAPADRITITPYGGLENATLLLVEALSGGQYDLPLGEIETSDGSVQIRNLSDVTNMDELRALPVTIPDELVTPLSTLQLFIGTFESATPDSLLADLYALTQSHPELSGDYTTHVMSHLQDLIAFKAAHPAKLTDAEALELYDTLELGELTGLRLSEEAMKLVRETDLSASPVVVPLSAVASAVGPGDEGYTPGYEAYAYYDGVQAVKVSVYAAAGANGTSVVRAAKEIAAELSTDTVTVSLTDDSSEFISDSVSNVLVSMLIGGVLAVVVIFLFLKKVKPSLIISVTMPLSVLGALFFLFAMGITLNMVSLGGLAVGIGMLVDNSIVVTEAVSKRRELGDRPFLAAVNGTAEVAGALVGSTLTTVCVFVPILFVGGLCAEIFTDLAWAVIWSLAFSLLVAVTVIPALYVLFSRDRKLLSGSFLECKAALAADEAARAAAPEAAPESTAAPAAPEAAPRKNADALAGVTAPALPDAPHATPKRRKREGDDGVIMRGVKGLYGKLLPVAVRHRVVVVVVAICLFAASIGLLFTTGTEFLPSVDKGLVEVSLNYYGTTTLDEAETDAAALAGSIGDELPDAEISVSVGVQGLLAIRNTGMISVKLAEGGDTEEAARVIRELTEAARSRGDLPHTSSATVTEVDGVVESITGGISELSVEIYGDDPAKLAVIADDVAEMLVTGKYAEAGFESATGSAGEDNTAQEYDIAFDRTAIAELGLDYSQIVLTLRAGLAGYAVGDATVDGVTGEVSVGFAPGTIASAEDLENFTVGMTSSGGAVRLGDVAEVTVTTADTMISKTDGRYAVTVSAETYELDSGTAGELMAEAAEAALAKTDPDTGESYAAGGYDYATGGVSDFLNDAFDGLYVALIVSVFLLYAVMAAQFRSGIKPLIIMCSIPFSVTGAFIAMAMTNMTLSVVSFVGIIMLMGVIVNNAIVLLERIRQLRDDGLTHYDAVLEGCKARLRPILMTTLTTVLALIPLALGLGSGGELMQPLGIVVMGGLILGTLVTLLLIPAVYCLVNGISRDRPDGRKGAKRPPEAESGK